MKKNCFYVLVAAAWMAVSCTNNEIPTQSSSDQAITIVANVSPQSRVPQLDSEGAGSFIKGDVMTLCVAKTDGSNLSMNYAYQVDEITWGGLNLSENTGQVKIAACYPKQTLSQDGTFEFNVLTAPDKDLLLSSAQNVAIGTSEAVNLSFGHALHRLDVSFTAGDGYSADDLKNLSLSMSASTVCVVDAFQGKIKEVKSAKDNYASSTGATASFYLLPQSTDGVTLHITMNGKTQHLVLRDLFQQLNNPQDTLKGGSQCAISLKVSREGVSVDSGSIGAWENQVTVEGEVTVG